MDIVLFSHEFLPYSGGIATYNDELARGLTELGHDVTVLAPRIEKSDPKDLPYQVQWINGRTSRTQKLKSAFRLLAICRRNKPDFVISTESYASMVCALVHRFTNTKYASVVHGTELLIQANPKTVARSIIKRMLQHYYKRSQRIICVSKFTADVFKQSFDGCDRKISIVHNGMSSGQATNAMTPASIREKWSIPDGAVVLFTLARLTPRKGQDYTIKALAKVLQNFPQVYYLCAGAGSYEKSLKQLARDLSISDRVIFPGRIDDEEKVAYYQACDLFVMPSRKDVDGIEGFGLSFLEAWHASKPVLGSRHGGVAEVIDDGINGLAVDSEDIDAIAAGITRALSDPDGMQAMGRAGHEKATRLFTREAMASSTIDALLAQQ